MKRLYMRKKQKGRTANGKRKAKLKWITFYGQSLCLYFWQCKKETRTKFYILFSL